MPPSERRVAIAITTWMRSYLGNAVGWDFKRNTPIFPDYSELNKSTKRRRR